MDNNQTVINRRSAAGKTVARLQGEIGCLVDNCTDKEKGLLFLQFIAHLYHQDSSSRIFILRSFSEVSDHVADCPCCRAVFDAIGIFPFLVGR